MVMKIVGPKILHKTEVGGMELDLEDDEVWGIDNVRVMLLHQGPAEQTLVVDKTAPVLADSEPGEAFEFDGEDDVVWLPHTAKPNSMRCQRSLAPTSAAATLKSCRVMKISG